MVDMNDKSTDQLFSDEDWLEIASDLPEMIKYETATVAYIELFTTVRTVRKLQDKLKSVLNSQEYRLVHRCLSGW